MAKNRVRVRPEDPDMSDDHPDMSDNHPEIAIKAPPCPNCGSTEVAAVLYSHPGCSEEIHLDSETSHGLIAADPEEFEKAPEWCCTRCNLQFGPCTVTDEKD